MKTFIQELKTRRVYRVAIAYLIAGSAIVQVAGTILPIFHAPEWAQQGFVFLLALFFPMALVLAWSFDVKGGSITRTTSGRGRVSQANRRRLFTLFLIGCLIAGAGLLVFRYTHRRPQEQPVTTSNIPNLPEKSIAVLPFANLSEEKENGYFTEGMNDEIVTLLAKIPDLKVISRTSVMQYKNDATRNLKRIASELGVTHIVEGTVQRVADRVRITAQLIDARTDTQIWGDHYDRDLADVFSIQTEVAEKIVSQLQGTLSPHQKAALADHPTRDLEAYDLYLHARSVIDAITFSDKSKQSLLEGIQLLREAIARDSDFLLAHYQLARAHDQLYFLGIDHTPARLAQAEAAIQTMQLLQPDAGETHLAIAQNLYWGRGNYDRAREELELARARLPNEPLVGVLAGYIDRRQGRLDKSIREMERALELDPRNVFILQQISFTYDHMHLYPERIAILERVLKIAPEDHNTPLEQAEIELDWRGDAHLLTAKLAAYFEEGYGKIDAQSERRMLVAFCNRDRAEAQRALLAMPPEGVSSLSFYYPKSFYAGLVARVFQEGDHGRKSFGEARAELEKIVRDQPAYYHAWSILGLVDAFLGDKDAAIAASTKATELLPISKDAITGPALVENLALTYAWVGEKEKACEQLRAISKVPTTLSYGHLLLHPLWDPLRGDECFERIVSSLAPAK